MQRAVKDIYVDPLIKQYIVSIVDATRKHGSVYLGASPRGSLALYRTCQARALLDGRDFVLPDDVKELAYATLGHRIIIAPGRPREERRRRRRSSTRRSNASPYRAPARGRVARRRRPSAAADAGRRASR